MRKRPITLNDDEETTALVTSNEPHSLLIMDKFEVLKVRIKKENPTPEDWIILRAMLCTLTSAEALEFQTKQEEEYSFAVSQVINNNLNQPSSDESQVIVRNRSIMAELKDFEQHKRGQRKFLRKNLQTRLPYASYNEQRKILTTFLGGLKTDRMFAYKYFSNHWDETFREQIQLNFEQFYDVGAAKLILQYWPDDYVMLYLEKLRELCGYVSVCIHLPNQPIDRERVKPSEYLYLLAKLKRSINRCQAEDILYKHIITYLADHKTMEIPQTPWSLLSIPDVSLMIWSFGHLNLFESILQFDEINRRVIAWFDSIDRTTEFLQHDILMNLFEDYHQYFDKQVVVHTDDIEEVNNSQQTIIGRFLTENAHFQTLLGNFDLV